MLFPTPKERLVEMIEPTKFTAKLEEPPVAVDPTSNQKSEQLPVYQRLLDRRRSDCAAGLRELRHPGGLRTARPHGNFRERRDRDRALRRDRGEASNRRSRPSMARSRCIIYSDPRDDGYFVNDVFPDGPERPARRRAARQRDGYAAVSRAIRSRPASARFRTRSACRSPKRRR